MNGDFALRRRRHRRRVREGVGIDLYDFDEEIAYGEMSKMLLKMDSRPKMGLDRELNLVLTFVDRSTKLTVEALVTRGLMRFNQEGERRLFKLRGAGTKYALWEDNLTLY